jgi:isocitrate dehydrogenase
VDHDDSEDHLDQDRRGSRPGHLCPAAGRAGLHQGHRGIEVETRDISLAGRIIANFPDNLTDDQKIDDDLSRSAPWPDARGQHRQAAQHQRSIPQLQAAIAELQGQGLRHPRLPEEPKNDEERELRKRFAVASARR